MENLESCTTLRKDSKRSGLLANVEQTTLLKFSTSAASQPTSCMLCNALASFSLPWVHTYQLEAEFGTSGVQRPSVQQHSALKEHLDKTFHVPSTKLHPFLVASRAAQWSWTRSCKWWWSALLEQTPEAKWQLNPKPPTLKKKNRRCFFPFSKTISSNILWVTRVAPPWFFAKLLVHHALQDSRIGKRKRWGLWDLLP